MKSKIGVAAVIGLLATVLLATAAAAQCFPSPPAPGPMIKFDSNGYAYASLYNPATFSLPVGSQFTTLGMVSEFCIPFLDLDPNDPNAEYTFILNGFTSLGTSSKPFGASGTQYTTTFSTGSFRVFKGTPRNVPAILPALPAPGVIPNTYIDGTTILIGVLDNFTIIVTRSSLGTYSGSFRADYRCTGGTLFSRVGSAWQLFSGAYCPIPPAPPVTPIGTCELPTGWIAHLNGKWDGPGTTAVTPSTWGTIKSLYR
jgi:hypothetical protein